MTKLNWEQWRSYMVDDCGCEEGEDGAVRCVECDEPVYESDFPNHNWRFCPVCEYDIINEEFKPSLDDTMATIRFFQSVPDEVIVFTNEDIDYEEED